MEQCGKQIPDFASNPVVVNIEDEEEDADDGDFNINDIEDDEDEDNEGDEDEDNHEDEEVYIGKIFDTPCELAAAYKRYAKAIGFAIKKKCHRKNEVGILRSVNYCCNRQGKSNMSQNPAKPSMTNRTGCKASVTARLYHDDKWEVSTFRTKHNHLVSPSKSRYMRCFRVVNPHVKHRLDLNDQSGIKMHKNYISVVNEAGGYDNITCTEKDCRNVIQELRRLRLGEGDAQAIWSYFSKKGSENTNFYFAVDLDEENHMKNVFWADGWSIEACKEFGEVISFDTTYLTNKYNMPFAPFVGVNHHGQSILLGCGLLSNEREETFVWLFNEWLKCMSGCAPQAIITDQDRAMQNAIKVVFPEARHRWCLWHVMKKVPDKFAKYAEKEKIIFAMKEVVYDTQTPVEFEECWQKMLEKYSLEENKWLSNLYAERQRWIPCYVKNTFWAGMSTTQRSESMNAFFDGFVHSKTSLKQFVEQYEQALRKKVEKELIADADSFSKSIPTITKYPFEKQIQQLYNLSKYREFQREITACINCVMLDIDERPEVSKYVLREDIWIEGFCKKLKFIVTFHKTETYEDEIEEETQTQVDEDIGDKDITNESESEEGESDESDESDDDESEVDESEEGNEKRRKKVDFNVHCSCQMFEFRGILCRHVITVLIRNGIRIISDKYILRRWRKDLKRSHTRVKVSFSCWENNEGSMRFNQLCTKFSEVADLASESDEQCKVVNEWLDGKMKELIAKSEEVKKVKVAEAQGVVPTSKIKDPKYKKRPGRPRSTRIKAKRSSRKRAKTKPSTGKGQVPDMNPARDHSNGTDGTVGECISRDASGSLFNGATMTQESVATAQMPQQVIMRAPRGTHTRRPRGTPTTTPPGTYMGSPHGPYMSSPHGVYASSPRGTYMGSPSVPYNNTSGWYMRSPHGAYMGSPSVQYNGNYTSVPYMNITSVPYMSSLSNPYIAPSMSNLNLVTPYEVGSTQTVSLLERLMDPQIQPWELQDSLNRRDMQD